MRSKTLLVSNLYATFFVVAIIHWIISAFFCGYDFFGNSFHKIYTLWLDIPVYIDLPVTWRFWWYYGIDETIEIWSNSYVYICIMIFSSITTFISYVLGWVAYATKKSIIACISAIIYLIVAFFMPIAIVYTLPLVALSIAGFFCQKALD